MTVTLFLALAPTLLGFAAIEAAADPSVRRLVIRDEVIVRVPVRPRLAPPRVEWKERKGPKCVPLASVRAAMLAGPNAVDFLLRDRRRVRAKLSRDCAALDFYGGFYLKTKDERMCADRDFLHSRMGGRCEIDRFRRLVPQLDD